VYRERQGFFKAEGLEVEVTSSRAARWPCRAAVRPHRHRFQQHGLDLAGNRAGLDAIMLAPGAVVRNSPPDTTTALIVRKVLSAH